MNLNLFLTKRREPSGWRTRSSLSLSLFSLASNEDKRGWLQEEDEVQPGGKKKSIYVEEFEEYHWLLLQNSRGACNCAVFLSFFLLRLHSSVFLTAFFFLLLIFALCPHSYYFPVILLNVCDVLTCILLLKWCSILLFLPPVSARPSAFHSIRRIHWRAVEHPYIQLCLYTDGPTRPSVRPSIHDPYSHLSILYLSVHPCICPPRYPKMFSHSPIYPLSIHQSFVHLPIPLFIPILYHLSIHPILSIPILFPSLPLSIPPSTNSVYTRILLYLSFIHLPILKIHPPHPPLSISMLFPSKILYLSTHPLFYPQFFIHPAILWQSCSTSVRPPPIYPSIHPLFIHIHVLEYCLENPRIM